MDLTPLQRADYDPHAAWRVQQLRSKDATWPEDEERQLILSRLGHNVDDELRLQALVRLRSIACGRDRQRLWNDEELRQGLLACAEGGPDAESLAANEEPQNARIAALGVLVNALRSAPNRTAVLRDPDARAVLLKAVKKTQGEDVSARAAMLFVTLLISALRAEKTKDSEDIQKAFFSVVNPEQPWETKVAMYGALWGAVSSASADRKALWKSPYVRDILLECANSDEETSEVLAIVLGALWAFTGEDDLDRERVWREDQARSAIVTGADLEQRVDVRVNALNAIANLAMAEGLREKLWEEAEGELARLVLASAAGDQPPDIREPALRTLVELSWEEKIRESMSWTGQLARNVVELGAHTLLYDAFEDWSNERRARLSYKYAHARLAILAPETLVMALVRARLADYLLPPTGEDEIVEHVDPATVERCEGARVRQRVSGDQRVGKIVDVTHGVLDVTVRWQNTVLRKLEPGELSYLKEDKPGDPAEAPDPDELKDIRVRSVYGRTGTIVKAQRRRDGKLKVEMRWDLQVFTAQQLGPTGDLEFVRSQDLRLVSRSVKDYVLPAEPEPPKKKEVPQDEQEPEPPPPERMKGREEFTEFEDYTKYVEELMKEHGGAENSLVQYYSDKPFCGVKRGMQGSIVRFDNMTCFAVRWDGFDKKWVDMWRCQFLETADKRFRWTETVPEPVYCGGGGSSGPDFEHAAVFEGAEVPESPTFTLHTKIRTKTKGDLQHFVAWGGLQGSRRSVDFRLTEKGNLEYGEHTGTIAGGWKTVCATPPLKLADGKWHSIAVVRWVKDWIKEQDSGNVTLFCDGELVGQGVITADPPVPLEIGAKAGRFIKGDCVYQGHVAPLRIYKEPLTVEQVRAVDLLSGTPSF